MYMHRRYPVYCLNLHTHAHVGAGAYSGCAYCTQSGDYSKNLDKMIYLGHRRFLPQNDMLRSNHKDFPTKGVCKGGPPQPKTQEYIDEANGTYLSLSTKAQQVKHCRETGCKGPNSLRKLTNHDRYNNTPVEPMHTIKNISERMVHLISGISDSSKVREEEYSRDRFVPLGIVRVDIEKGLPTAKFRLSKNELVIANQRSHLICTPHGFDWSPVEIFKRSTHLKSVRWMYVLSSGILKFCIRGLLGSFQRKTLYELCDIVSLLVAESVDVNQLDAIEYRVHRVLSLIERDFPVTVLVIMLHLLHHLPMFIRRFGPVYGFWMFPVERFNSWISKRALNRRFPEATVLESNRMLELSFFFKIANQLPESSIVDPSELDFAETEDDSLEPPKADQLEQQHEHTTTLSDCQMVALKQHYELTIPDYDPENLSEQITNSVRPRKHHKVKDSYHRTVMYTCRQNSIHSSHIVCNKRSPTPKETKFGEITLVFEHFFCSKWNKLLFVSWFDEFELDTESRLIAIELNGQPTDMHVPTPNQCSVVSPEMLERPLIHVYDSDKLWILNYNLDK